MTRRDRGRSIAIAAIAALMLGPPLIGEAADQGPKEMAHGAEEGLWTCPMHPMIEEKKPGSCPICGMTLVPKAAGAKDAEASPARQPAAEQGKTEWTCEMHPQIVQDEPGTCPICGMDLISRQVPVEQKRATRKNKGPRKIKYWVAPMNPRFRSDKPGKSPMGMDLVPVYEGGSGEGLVEVDPVVVQNMGVRIALVRRGRIARNIRTIGVVQVAEDLVSVVNLRFSGWIERLRVDETGIYVKRGQALFELYSPELVSAEEEYVLALRTSAKGSALAKSARRRLELFGLSGGDIRRVEKDRRPRRRHVVRAPRSGYVMHKSVVEGARIDAGKDVFRIADLSTVWIEAEVYEHDVPFVKVGAAAQVELTFQRGVPRDSVVAYIYPNLNPRSRTLRVRLEMKNTDLGLKPGSFATVLIEAEPREDVLTIPTEAIIHSGEREIVFVVVDLGRYEAREVETGLIGSHGLTELRKGLSEGERVVTSGQFLLDSESQLQEAVQKMIEAQLDAKAAHAAQEDSPGDGKKKKAEDGAGDTYWTCGMHPQVVQDGPGTCPICGMDLIEKKR